MSLNPETITQIQSLLQSDPPLLAQLQVETELAGVAAVIAKAAAAQGLDVSEADLLSHLAAEQSQASAAAMSDAELEQVAGGGIGVGILGSICVVGLGCALASIYGAVSKHATCGKALAELSPIRYRYQYQ